MRVTFDPAKRVRTLVERGLEFADAEAIFAGVTVEIEDTRRNYGEKRVICYGLLAGRACRRRLHAAGRGSPCFQHEEGQ